MTPAEHIAYLRDRGTDAGEAAIAAVCDLAERALADEQRCADLQHRLDAMNDVAWAHEHAHAFTRELFRLSPEEAEAVRGWLKYGHISVPVDGVLKRLLGDEPPPVEHLLEDAYKREGHREIGYMAKCSCGQGFTHGKTMDAAVRAWAAHAGIGGTDGPS